MILQRLRLMFQRVMEADPEERVEALRTIAEHHDALARAARAKIPQVMSEPIVEKMRESGF